MNRRGNAIAYGHRLRAAPSQLSALTLLFSIIIFPVAAEQNDGDQQQKSRVLEEILVTATKRNQSVRDIPVSITAFVGEDLERSGAQGYADFLKQAPGVNLADDGINVARITIRGIAADIGGNLTTGTLFGDVPFTDPYLPRVALDPNPFDLASVEILKGPQGTLFGGSALNGAIRYVPRAPRMGEWELRLFAQTLSIEGGERAPVYGAALNIPLFDRDDFALRIMAFDRERPGVIDEVSRGEEDVDWMEQTGSRAMLSWQPDGPLRVDLMHLQQSTFVNDYSFADNTEGRLERGNTPKSSPVDTEYSLSHINIEYDFSFGHFVSQSSRIEKTWIAVLDTSRLVSGQAESLTADVFNQSIGYVQEFRLLSPESSTSPWQWLIGLYGYQVDLDELFDVIVSNAVVPVTPAFLGVQIPGLDGYIGEDGQINAAHFVPDVRVRELALFGEVTREVYDKWEFTVGLRAYRVRSGGSVTTSGALNAPSNLSSFETESVNDAAIEEQDLSPKIAVRYSFNDDLQLFASASRGFRFGGIQLVGGSDTDDIPDTFESDSLWNYEIGVRSEWLSQALRLDLTLFYIDWKKPQILQPARGGVVSFQDNVGGARSQGAELAVRYLLPWPTGMSLDFSGAYVDTRTTEVFSTISGAEIPPGTRWPYSSFVQTNASLSYTGQLWNFPVSAALSYSTQSEAFINLEHSAEVFGYHTLDAQLSVAFPKLQGSPELTIAAGNLTDKRGVAMVTQQATVLDITYIRPQNLMLRLDLNF